MEYINMFTGWNFFWLWPISWVVMMLTFWSSMKEHVNLSASIALMIILGPFLLLVLSIGTVIFSLFKDNGEKAGKAVLKGILSDTDEVVTEYLKKYEHHKPLYELVKVGKVPARLAELLVLLMEHAALVSLLADQNGNKKAKSRVDELMEEAVNALIVAASIDDDTFISTLALTTCRVKEISDEVFSTRDAKTKGEQAT